MSHQDVDKLWQRFQRVTRARIALGRSGDALPTRRLLEFSYAHASARDAVAARADFDAIAAQLLPIASLRVASAAGDRSTYLRRPDLGRRLAPGAAATLPAGPFDAVFVIADGLSASAVQAHAVPLMKELHARLADWKLGPAVLAGQARVALGDEVGAAMGAAQVAVLIGERPGLSVPNSLGVYLTYAPQIGRRDSERNCISNIHGDGLSYAAAAQMLVWLMTEARRLRLTGVGLKEDARGTPKPLDSAPPKLRSSKQQQGD
jgi:ethanolamine ammonia-lyase small subunit